jgi:peptide/nickel transport system ATP-binding protein
MLDRTGPIVRVQGLTKRFEASKPWLVRALAREPRCIVHAVEDVTFAIERGQTFALVGESGCGKSTIARCVAGILKPTAGAITFMSVDLAAAREGRAARAHRRHLQMIFQDPYASLNPRWRVGRIIAEPIVTHRLLNCWCWSGCRRRTRASIRISSRAGSASASQLPARSPASRPL